MIELCCKKKDGSGIDRKGWNCTNFVVVVVGGGVTLVIFPEAVVVDDADDDGMMIMMIWQTMKTKCRILRINTTTISGNDEDGGTRCQ